MPALSAIIPLRNRSGLRLENCLRSLRWQDRADEVEVVLSDFGSDEDHARSIAELAERYGALVETTATEEVWNRSRALNIGMQRASADWVFCTDADMIFAPNFASSILDAARGEVMIHCRCHDLPETVDEQLWTLDDYPRLHEAAELRDTKGTGACQVAPRAFFFHARGYDEKFRYWGAEDVDMTSRAEAHGLDVVWITEQTAMLHQWHPTTKYDKKWRRKLNKWRYKLTSHIVVKNPGGWGKQP